MLPKNLMEKMENSEWQIVIDGEVVAELKYGDIETVSDIEDGKIHITQTADRIVVTRDGIILDECVFDDCIDDYKDELDPIASVIQMLDRQQEKVDDLVNEGYTLSFEDEIKTLGSAEDIKLFEELRPKGLFHDWQDPNKIKEYTKKYLKEMFKTKPDPLFIPNDSGLELIKDREPSVICVLEKTDRSSFMSSIGTGGKFAYYADEYRVNELNQYEIVSNGNIVAMHLMENVERIWNQNAVVKKEVEEDNENEE